MKAKTIFPRPIFLLGGALTLALLGLGPAAQAQLSQHFTFDTSAVRGLSGFLDFQFAANTDGTTPLNSTLTLSGFSGGALGTVNAAGSVNVTGALPGSAAVSNAGAGGELMQAFTFGSSLSFDTALPVPAPGGAADEGNTFQFFVLDSGANLFQTTDPSGANALAAIDQAAGGAVSPARTYTLVALAPVPEASTTVSLGLLLALGGLSLAARRRRKGV